MKVSINILTWNCFKTLEQTFEVLFEELKDTQYEVIVVDNGSIDDSKEYMKQQCRVFNNIKYIYNTENKGISHGKNQGIENSVGDYVLMLDADIVPVRGSLISLISYLNQHEDVDALGFHPDMWTSTQNEAETFCYELVEVAPVKRSCIYYGIYRKLIFDIGLRLDDTGVFDGVGYGWEDHDFYETMKAMGITQYACHINKPNTRYYHQINSSIRNMGREKYMESSRARADYFHSKWG